MVETGRTAEILAQPLHPYTIGLLNAIPSVRTPGRRLESIPGTLPHPSQRGVGCPFSGRCTMAVAQCRSERPVLRTISGDRSVACHVVAGH
jgi:oligopeptide/dipeptide ABC transporter ATP-binding protein